MNKVVIMSGISGSGKSTYTAKLLQSTQGVEVSADHYFTTLGKFRDGGGYHFDAALLSEAHADCFRRFITYLQATTPFACIVVDNTNLSSEEIAPYYLGAQAFGYSPEIITLRANSHQFGEMMSRNVHNVGYQAIVNQFAKLNRRQMPPWWSNTDIPVSIS